ncbi:hypothetical protein Prudu_012769, partial [Prunus dulcis]
NIIFVHSHFQPVFRPQAVEVRWIHHRAILSFHVSSQGKKVICARHSPGVGHAQDLARIPKWKLDLSLSSRSQTARDLHPFNSSPRPPYLEPISAVGTVGTVTRPPFFSDQHQPRGAGIWPENYDFGRWFVRMPPELPAQISPPFLHQIDRAPGARQNFKGDLRGIEAVEVRGIHHRANHSFRAKGRLCRIFDRSLRQC